jgi:hypothetical protein
MANYKSLASFVREILEKKELRAKNNQAPGGGPETDMNDQIAVGSYNTKAFEMSNKAQKLYSNLPKETDSNSAEQAAIHLDQLFALHKTAKVKGYTSPEAAKAAQEHADKVMYLAKALKMEKQFGDIVDDSMSYLKGQTGKYPSNEIEPDQEKSPENDSRFNTPSKDYTTDRNSDRDVDNVKNFLIKRSLKAQRKLKIIDND